MQGQRSWQKQAKTNLGNKNKVIHRVIPTATHALIRITLFFGNLSEQKPAGEMSNMKGNRISALTIAVKTICSWPS